MATRLFVLIVSIVILNFVTACDTYYTQSPGPQGDPGLIGEKGDPGQNGIDGQDGESCTVVENDDGSANLVCSDGTTWPLGEEEGDGGCQPYLNYPKQGEYVTSHVDGEQVAPLGVMLIPDGYTFISGTLEINVEDGCGSGAVIDYVDVTVENIPVEPDPTLLPPTFFARVNDSVSGVYEALAIPGEPQALVATIPIGRPVAPDYSAYVGVVLQDLPPMTAAQTAGIVLGINITFTDVDTGNQYMMGGWQFHQ